MRDLWVGASMGLLVGGLASLPWRAVRQPVAVSQVPPGDSTPSETRPATATDLDRAVRLLARHAGEGWIRCPVGTGWADAAGGAVREWSHAIVEDGLLVATVAEPEGSAALHALTDPTSASPRVVVQWREAFAGEAGRCEVSLAERITMTGLVTGRTGRPIGGGRVHGELGSWEVDADGYFEASCYRGAPCRLTPEPSPRRRVGHAITVVVHDASESIELGYVPARRPWLARLQREVDARERAIHMIDPIELALRDPQMPPPMATLFLRWQERDEAVRLSAAGLLDAIAVH